MSGSAFHRIAAATRAAVAMAASIGVSSQLLAAAPLRSEDPPSDGSKLPLPADLPPATAPATQARPTTGSLSIHVLQGTPGEPAIGAMPLSVELYHRGMLLDTIKTSSDEHGVVILEGISIAMPVTPVVKVKYANLDYQVGGGVLDAQHPRQEIQVVCFASTEVPPAWNVAMRHMMVVPEAGGLRVSEMMVVRNPEARTWIGMPGFAVRNTQQPGQGGSQPAPAKRVTTAFVLPAGATDVQLGRGFHKWCCSSLVNGSLVNHLPLMPETSEMMYSYLLPPKDGIVKLDITAPAGVDNTMLLMPAGLEAGAVEGLSYGGEQAMAEGSDAKVRVYMAGAMAAGQVASISVAGLAQIASPPAGMGPGSSMPGSSMPGSGTAGGASPTAAVATSSGRMAKIVGALGGGAMLLVAAVLLFRRPSPAQP